MLLIDEYENVLSSISKSFDLVENLTIYIFEDYNSN